MKLFMRTATMAALMPCFAMPSWGLGLGDISMRSYLNEPLRAEVELLDVKNLSAEDIRIRLATQEDFDRLGVERAYFLTDIRFEVVVDGDASRIIITTEKPLLEPYLDFLLETRWPAGRLLREYTVLVDLPRQDVVISSATARSGSGGGARETRAVTESVIVETPSEPSPRIRQPAVRPERAYDRDAEDRPEAGGTYMVKANDTLWSIAASARPQGATVEQTMIVIAATNSEAFTAGNINGLMAGYVLNLPGEDEIFLSRAEATDAVALQNRDWARGVRSKPALRVVVDSEMDDPMSEPPAEDTEAVTEDDFEPVDTGSGAGAFSDDPMVAGSDAPGMEDAPVDGGDMAGEAAAESADFARIEARLLSLSDQVGDLRELVSVKDEQIAALQAELAARDRQPAPVPASSVANEAPQQGGAWWLYGLIVLVLAGLGGFLFLRLRARSHAGDTPELAPAPAPAALKPAPAPEAASEAPEAAAVPGEDGERGYGKKLHNDYAQESGISDAIAEADIYVAYGRHQQALDLLASASANEPGNASAYLKMIDIYLKTDRIEEARALLPRIEQTHDLDALKTAMAQVEGFTPSSGALDSGDLGGVGDDAGQSLASMDFDLVDRKPDAPGAPEAPKPEASGMPGDLQLDLEPAAPAADLSEEPGEGAASDLPDFSAQSAAMAETVTPAEEETLPPELAEVLGTDTMPLAGDTTDEPEEESGLIYSLETDPMDTKLDLARAYIDMGDEDGARPVLEEVIAKGDLQQQAEARELLIRIE